MADVAAQVLLGPEARDRLYWGGLDILVNDLPEVPKLRIPFGLSCMSYLGMCVVLYQQHVGGNGLRDAFAFFGSGVGESQL